jgi:hypothetical protein
MVGVGPDSQFTEASYRTFRVLVTALIGLGMLGFCAALSTSRHLQQILNAIIGADRAGHEGGTVSLLETKG